MKLSLNDSIWLKLMTKQLEKILRNHPRTYLTDAELEALLPGTANSRYGIVKRMLAQGKLLHLRRGLYCITNEIGYIKKPHPYELAQYVYGPSYISLESALSYHHLIPEAVYTTTSVTSRRSKEFETPLGIFSYRQVPLEDLYMEVEIIEENGYKFFMAKPWKAICDYIFCYKKNWNNLEPLLNSLRIDFDNLPILQNEESQLLEEYYHHARVSRFLKGIKKEIKYL